MMIAIGFMTFSTYFDKISAKKSAVSKLDIQRYIQSAKHSPGHVESYLVALK